MKKHLVIIQKKGFWNFTRYRWFCKKCLDHGRWYSKRIIANEQGWHHDDVTLFNQLTAAETVPTWTRTMLDKRPT